ncbi:MAG: T9SS type A sorting domain-containing protein [Bacteroidetes bacterium]|nr:T9SS type A sorting domain-containing protein [Bacteroidota bacterium]
MRSLLALSLFVFQTLNLAAQTGAFTDPRDGQTYNTVVIWDQLWMAENLNYDVSGTCQAGLQANCDTFGRMYTFTEALNICPSVWHLPDRNEWEELIDHWGQDSAGIALRDEGADFWFPPLDPLVVGTNESGFTALGAGNFWGNIRSLTSFWSSVEYSVDYAYDYGTSNEIPDFSPSWGNKTHGRSVRCLNDTPTGIKTIKNEPIHVIVSPNPTRNLLLIRSPELIEVILVISLAGQTIKELSPMDHNFELETDNLAPGLYLLRLIGKGFSSNQKISVF